MNRAFDKKANVDAFIVDLPREGGEMHKKVLELAVATTFALPMAANAVIIDFQSLEHVDGLTTNVGTSYSEDGFTISQVGSQPFPLATFGTLESRYSGSTALFNNTVNGSTQLARTGGGTFDLFSIDLAELNGSFAASVTFTTNNGDSQTFSLDGIAFGAQTFTFNNNFLGITSVSWSQVTPFHQFDNVVVDQRIPEPGTLALLGLGLAGLAATRKRKQ